MSPPKYTIENLRDHACKRGGSCLSAEYNGPHDRYQWECSTGHTWSARWSNVMRGSWCPDCSGRTRGSIEYMHELAHRQGGRCLSEAYVNAQSHLEWECAHGHRWHAKPNNIQQGQWCPTCRQAQASQKQLRSISILQEYAASKGGRLLTDSYLHSREKLEWECSSGHRWRATTQSTYAQECWCPKCGDESGAEKRLKLNGLEECQRIAAERGGQLLSTEYRGVNRKYSWCCQHGHQWELSYAEARLGRWCPECSSGLGERITRAHFEQIFGKSFTKVRPKWMLTPEGTRLELDGYCDELKLAFEHQGAQHYRAISQFGGTEETLRRQIERDQWKRTLCKDNGIALIEVPEVPTVVPVPKLKDHILALCDEFQVAVPRDAVEKQIDLRVAYAVGPLQRLREVAEGLGGSLLSEHFHGYNGKHEWRCSDGHKWKASASSVVHQNTWCPHCAGIFKYTIEKAREVAKSRGGTCLSEHYVGAREPLRWQCSCGYAWETALTNVMRGSWCPKCAGQAKPTIEDMRVIALQRGGECLSSEYVNSKTHLRWRCSKGHEWAAIPLSVVHKKSWCPKCAGQAKPTIEDMREVARQRGGECLSSQYVNSNSNLQWRCSNGHVWDATPNNVVNKKSWCLKCRWT